MTEWIEPWYVIIHDPADDRVHFIPVTQMYAEIYNIYAYFSGPSNAMANSANITRSQYQQGNMNKLDGDAELRKIAEAGREWMFAIGRKIDMESESGLGQTDNSLRVSTVLGMGTTQRRRSRGHVTLKALPAPSLLPPSLQ
jgi:hypothetical protein